MSAPEVCDECGDTTTPMIQMVYPDHVRWLCAECWVNCDDDVLEVEAGPLPEAMSPERGSDE